MELSNIEWLQQWYQKNCDGEWEHLYGIEIETLDNPGWHVKIDLEETSSARLQVKDCLLYTSPYRLSKVIYPIPWLRKG